MDLLPHGSNFVLSGQSNAVVKDQEEVGIPQQSPSQTAFDTCCFFPRRTTGEYNSAETFAIAGGAYSPRLLTYQSGESCWGRGLKTGGIHTDYSTAIVAR